MIQKRVIFIIFLLSSIVSQTKAQETSDYQMFSNLFDVEHRHTDHSHFLKSSTNELELVVSALFLGYKKFVSSQDGISCVFHPSCSQYAMETITNNGFLQGTFDAFDRLCRCNAFSPELYEIHSETNLFYDPVK